MRPSAEYRPMGTDRHEIIVQKNGRVDVFLRNGMPLFSNVYPMVWLEGEPEAKALKVDGRATTREELRDRLGVGQEMRFHHKTNQWAIRVYPLEPFITVQLAYVNATKKPVKVKALIPWAVGGRVDGASTLGPRTGDARVLRYPDQRFGGTGPAIEALGAPVESDWLAAFVNPASGRSMLLGFLSAEKGWPRIEAAKSEETADALAPLRALSVYDPPVTVEPGGRLESETLYISLSDPDAFSLLERFGQAFGVANGLQPGAQRPMGEIVAMDGAAAVLRPDTAAPEGQTRVQAYRAALAAARDGAGADAAPIGNGPVFLDGPYVAGFAMGGSDVEAVLGHGRQYFLAPWAYRPVFPEGDANEAVRMGRRLSGALWLTEGAGIASERPYRPADLFVRDEPRIWTRGYGDLPGGPLQVVAVFNWGAEEDGVTVALDQAGLAADGFYTVYELPARRYAGTVTERLTVETAPGGVRLFALRPFRETPQVVAVEPDPLKEAESMASVAWSPASRTLHGTTARAGEMWVHILVPAGFAASETRVGGKPVRAPQENTIVRLPIGAGAPAGTAWEVRF